MQRISGYIQMTCSPCLASLKISGGWGTRSPGPSKVPTCGWASFPDNCYSFGPANRFNRYAVRVPMDLVLKIDETPFSNPHVRQKIYQRTHSTFRRRTDYFRGIRVHIVYARACSSAIRESRKKIALTLRGELLTLRENSAGSKSADSQDSNLKQGVVGIK